jgi:hypothetical protein
VVVVDRSAAMAQSWPSIARALSSVFADPRMDTYGTALRLFPDPQPIPGCDTSTCSVEACATPLVPAAELSGFPAPEDTQEQALTDALSATFASMEDAPLGAAVEGALLEATRLRRDYDRVRVVLATAEIGGGCGRDIGALVEKADLDSGIRTAVVAPASSDALPELDALAARGGSSRAFPIGPNAEGVDDLVQWLTPEVPESFVCDFPLPEMPPGAVPTFDATVLTVTVGQAPVDVERVAEERACGEAFAWYLDDGETPTRVLLCPALCGAIHQGLHVELEISVSCQ